MSAAAAPPLPPNLAASSNPFVDLLRRYFRNPLAFVREVLGVEPDPWQRDVLEKLGEGRTRISIRSGHGVGKSTMLAWALIWFLFTHFPGKAVVTAPTAPQLFDALWAEMRSWLAKLPPAWLALLDITSDRVALKAAPDEGFISARTSRAETPDALQGIHAKWVLLVVDEAPGVPEQVFEAAGGSMSTPGAITILAGNPTRTTGTFWRTHHTDAERWYCVRVSCLDSPRVDPQFAADIAASYGLDSNRYRIRVLGEFPLAEGDTLIPSALVEEAMQRPPEIDLGVPEVWGVDVARFGADASVLVKRRGNAVLEMPRRWRQFDTMQLSGALMNEWSLVGEYRPVAVMIDSIGIGAGVADRLRELGVPAIDVNVSESASMSGRFVRLRDELWQGARDWLATRRVSLPYDEQLRADLCGPRYTFMSTGALKVETKDQLRARSVESPDSADALCMTFAPGALLAGAYAFTRNSQPMKRNIRGIV